MKKLVFTYFILNLFLITHITYSGNCTPKNVIVSLYLSYCGPYKKADEDLFDNFKKMFSEKKFSDVQHICRCLSSATNVLHELDGFTQPDIDAQTVFQNLHLNEIIYIRKVLSVN